MDRMTFLEPFVGVNMSVWCPVTNSGSKPPGCDLADVKTGCGCFGSVALTTGQNKRLTISQRSRLLLRVWYPLKCWDSGFLSFFLTYNLTVIYIRLFCLSIHKFKRALSWLLTKNKMPLGVFVSGLSLLIIFMQDWSCWKGSLEDEK